MGSPTSTAALDDLAPTRFAGKGRGQDASVCSAAMRSSFDGGSISVER
jgi:hypothetical protein